MKTKLFLVALLLTPLVYGAGYVVGDKADGFSLKNIDGKVVSLDDFPDAKGFIVIFTCNHCPYAVAYQDRIIALDEKYKTKGYPVIAINSNDAVTVPGDSYDGMVERAREKGFTFPYLHDEMQEVAKTYGATRTPHVFILQKNNQGLVVKYIGAIDDNYQDESAVTKTYVSDAIESLLAGKNPDPDFTKAIGCTIKWKK